MAGVSALKTRWREWSARFAALQAREKHMIAGALGVVILFGGYTFWIEPPQLQAARLKKTLVQQNAEQEQLRTQILALAAQSRDPDAPNRETLKRVRAQLALAERDIKGFDRALVAPTQAPVLLQTLLTRHRGLNLISLTTQAPQPLLAPSAVKAEGTEAAPMPGGNIYKHGIEIKLSGAYLDLLAYVSELEAAPQKLLWGDISLDASRYPVTEMTLTVYSLSLEATWLVV